MHHSLDSTLLSEWTSPLWVVTQEPHLTALVAQLQSHQRRLVQEPEQVHPLQFSSEQVNQLRESFASVICRGEFRLHSLCSLLSRRFFKNFEIASVVIGETCHGGERFTLVQSISEKELFGLTDLDLGTRQLSKLRFLGESSGQWIQPNLVANFVEYQPLELDDRGIHRLTSRIKAEEEIWNKVVDEMFGVDQIVQRDKQLAHLSRYVKDIFGLKIVLGNPRQIREFYGELEDLEFLPQELADLDIPDIPGSRRLTTIEVKDYLETGAKRSGWQAIKSVVRWWDSTIEIQVQPLRNYLQERERLTKESHASFKTRRDELRAQLEARLPLYAFYRGLLRWLFLRPDLGPPQHPNVQITMS